MKCPRCWADKAYVHPFRGWREVALGCLAFRFMKCQHCYHRFVVHWLLTIGKCVVPPVLRVTDHEASRAKSSQRNGHRDRSRGAA